MDLFLNRFRNVTVLLALILVQLALLAYQVKSNQEVRLIRVWAVSAVTPFARVLDTGRRGVSHFFRDYFILLDVREDNERLRKELDQSQLDNQYFRSELSTADRAAALAIFQTRSANKTIAAHTILNTADLNGKAVMIDAGSPNHIQKGMAVITPGGIVGKVIGVYPTASSVLLLTDPNFTAGVVSQTNHVYGRLKGQGSSTVIVDGVPNEQKVDAGEWFFTSGDDGIFPKGLRAGQVSVVRAGASHKEILLTPSGFVNGLEDVLVIVEGVHAPIPEISTAAEPVYVQAPPADAIPAPTPAPVSQGPPSPDSQNGSVQAAAPPPPAAPNPPGRPQTDADRLIDQYKNGAKQRNITYGDHNGRGAPDFNAILQNPGANPKPAPPATKTVPKQ